MIALLLLIAAADGTTPRLAVPGAVFAEATVVAPEPRLVWPAGTHLRASEDEGELVVRYDRPLDERSIAAFRSIAGEAIGDLRWNDDSLVLRAAPGWRLDWRQQGAAIAVAFLPPPGEATPSSAADAGPDEAAIARIEADAAAGYTGRARRAAAALHRRFPDDRRVARLLADTRAADGDQGGAARGYKALDARDRAARRAMASAPGSVGASVTARDGSDLSQAEFAARVDAALDDRLALGGGVRRIVTDLPAEARRGATIVDASVAAGIAERVRVQLLASAALDDAVTGGGAKLVAGSADAQLRATASRHLPDYSTPAQVRRGGYQSRALIGGSYRLSPGIVVQADAGWQRYGLAREAGATDTIVASGGVDYLIRRQFPALGLTYRMEAEYVQRMRRGADALPVVPLATCENHTLQGFVSASAGEVQLTALAGWTVDRFGGNGPTASLGVAAPIGIGWRVEGSGGITSVSRPGFGGRQLFVRAAVTRSLGDAR